MHLRRQRLPPASRLDRPASHGQVQSSRNHFRRNRKRENRKFERARMFVGCLEDLRWRRGSTSAGKSVSVQIFSGSQKNGVSQCHYAGRCQVTYRFSEWDYGLCYQPLNVIGLQRSLLLSKAVRYYG